MKQNFIFFIANPSNETSLFDCNGSKFASKINETTFTFNNNRNTHIALNEQLHYEIEEEFPPKILDSIFISFFPK